MSSAESSSADGSGRCCGSLQWTFAYWLLRIWLGLRLVASGFEKYKVKSTAMGEKPEYSMEAYDSFVQNTGKLIYENTIMSEAMVNLFMRPLGPLMISLGILILIGFLTRISLFLGGIVFVSLSIGMMLLPDPDQTLSLGLYVLFFAAALTLAKHDRISIDHFGRMLLGRSKSSNE